MTEAVIFLFHPYLIHNQAVPESKTIKALFHFSVRGSGRLAFPAARPGQTQVLPLWASAGLWGRLWRLNSSPAR